MRITTLVLGILGALFSAALAMVWLSDASQMKESIEELRSAGMADEVDSVIRGAYALLLAAGLGIAAGVLTMKGKGKVAAGMLLFAVVLPVVFSAKTLLGTFLFVIAALIAFKAQRPAGAMRASSV